MGKIFLSQSFDTLALKLSHALNEMQQNKVCLVQNIFVPTPAFKKRLMLKLAHLSPTKGVLGCKISTLDALLLPDSKVPSMLEMQCLIHQKLSQMDIPALRQFLSSAPNAQQELSAHLAALFFTYGEYGLKSFGGDWQRDLFVKLFEETPFSFTRKVKKEGEIFLFGFDFLSPYYWELLSRLKPIALFMFSPCEHFWEDICTEKEQRQLFTSMRKKGVSLPILQRMEELCSDMPILLSQLGKLGRETLKALDPYSFDFEPVYSPVLKTSLLSSLQSEIISLERSTLNADDSIVIFRTGSSLLHEVKQLKTEILRLVEEENLLFSEILVLSPDIEPYIPFVELTFAKEEIPYQFSRVSLDHRSVFYQTVQSLLRLISEPWSESSVVLFLQRKGPYQHWIERAYGYSKDVLKGLSELFLESFILFPGPKQSKLSLTELDLFEECFALLQSLQQDVERFKGLDCQLSVWADEWEQLVAKYVKIEGSDEDQRALTKSLHMLSSAVFEGNVGFEQVKDFLLQKSSGSIHPNQLHALSFSSLETGAIWPAKAIFLMGMKEGSFPRREKSSSMDLLREEKKYVPTQGDKDRYLFLQVLLNAERFLRISYCHVAPEDGKSVPASLVVQELKHASEYLIEEKTVLPHCVSAHFVEPFSIQPPSLETPIQSETILIEDLSLFARHPWKYFVQKKLNLFLQDSKESSFAAGRGLILKSALKWPLERAKTVQKKPFPGKLSEAFFRDVEHREHKRQKLLDGQELYTLRFLHSVITAEEKGGRILHFPPLEIALQEGVTIRLVGEITPTLRHQPIYLGLDGISGMLKVWPEILIAMVTLESQEVEILQKEKNKQLKDPHQALRAFLLYYLRCRNSLTPLMPDWANALLREEKQEVPWSFSYNDPVCNWILFRLNRSQSDFIQDWTFLRDTFAELIALYPTRKAHAEI